MAREAIKGDSTAEKTARHIEALILEGSLRPGDALLPERELAQRLAVSRPTLRQGIRILEDKGLLVPDAAGQRTVVALGARITDPLVDMLGSHAEVIEDYLEFRATTERMAASLAALRANAADRARMTECMEAIDAAHLAGDNLREAAADLDLHIAVYEASHNVVLLHIMRALSSMLRQGVIAHREKLFDRPETQEPLRAQHRAIYEAVMARDAAAAGQAAELHIRYTRQALAEITAAEARLEVSLRRIDGGQLGARSRKAEGR